MQLGVPKPPHSLLTAPKPPRTSCPPTLSVKHTLCAGVSIPRSQLWIPAGLGAENITTGDVSQIASAYDDIKLGPLFAARDGATQMGAVYYR